jgi:hypothetical protein
MASVPPLLTIVAVAVPPEATTWAPPETVAPLAKP